ncbi:MAG: MFS transporter [Pseudohongiellaceae bacterium]
MTESPATDKAAHRHARPRRLPRTFIAFESVPFRWLAGSHLAFFLAMQGQLLVRSLLAWELTGSELALAWVNLAIAIPMVFGAFIAGAVIDRVERRMLVMLAQSLILLNESIVLVLLINGKLLFWHLLGTSFVMGMIFPFVMPTRMAMVYALVGRTRLGNAMALQSGTMNVARVLGPAMTGILIPLISLQGAYMVAISLYLISTACMMILPACHPEQREGKSLLMDITYSFTYVASHRNILLCLVFGLFPMLLAMPVFSLLVVFADQVWQTGESGLGMLMATLGGGGILGALWVARLGANIRRARFMMAASLVFGILLACFSLSPYFALALLLLLSANVFSNISQTLNNTIIQLLAHDEVRGRMSSLVMISFGLTPLGVLPIAFASEKFGITVTVFTACILLCFIVLGFFLFSPTLRKLDEELAARDTREAMQ